MQHFVAPTTAATIAAAEVANRSLRASRAPQSPFDLHNRRIQISHRAAAAATSWTCRSRIFASMLMSLAHNLDLPTARLPAVLLLHFVACCAVYSRGESEQRLQKV